MKYRLKKDLPFAKAGERLVQIYHKGQFYTSVKLAEGSIATCDIPNSVVTEWIEEVKPREVYIHHHKLDAPNVARGKDDICFNCKCKPTLYREVIE